MPSTATACVTIKNHLGLHARPAMLFVEQATGYASDVRVRRTDQNEAVDGKSIMQLLILAATKDTEIEITATGDDAEDTLQALIELVNGHFHED